VTTQEELARLHGGDAPGPAPDDLDALEVETADAATALGRVREVLDVVLRHQDGEWPSIDEWKRLLPRWFVNVCVDDREVKDCILDRWSLRAWTHWLQPDQRRWRWWDATPTPRSLQIRVVPLQRPYLRGSLEWVLRMAAAQSD
jgi:hypothetical protein